VIKKTLAICIFYLIFITINIVNAQIENFTKIQVDNKIITNIDINNEKKFIKFISNQNIDSEELNDAAIQSLINRNIKEIEFENLQKVYKVIINDRDIIKEYDRYLNLNKKSENDLLNFFNKNQISTNYLKNVIRTEVSWNKLIQNIYYFKSNINLTEIETLASDIKKDLDNKNITTEQIKSNIAQDEFNKSINKFSQIMLDRAKKKYLIKVL